jgi:hypothetical protein
MGFLKEKYFYYKKVFQKIKLKAALYQELCRNFDVSVIWFADSTRRNST